MKKNKCYSPDCDDESCFDPEHYNYICYDPDCDEVHCINQEHYDKQLLRDFQESTDLSVYDHSEEIDYDEDVDISICGCPDCADDHDHEHSHSHEHEGHDSDFGDGHSHEHNHSHEHEGHDSDCGCDDDHDDVDISICGCPDCADEDDEHEEKELLAEGKPLIYNRPIQIIVSSAILFVVGHISL